MISSITNSEGTLDLQNYSAVCKGKKLTECDFDAKTFSAVRSLSPQHLYTKPGPYVLDLDFIVSGLTKQDVFKNVFELEHSLYNCSIVLIGETDFIHRCILIKASHRFIGGKAILSLKFSDIITGSKIEKNITTSGAAITLTGARETFMSFKITARTQLTNYMINDIKIKTLSNGEVMYIDGDDGTITVGGVNKFNDVEIYDFPTAKHTYTVTANLMQADIQLYYYPRW